jgi:hypothetical protein
MTMPAAVDRHALRLHIHHPGKGSPLFWKDHLKMTLYLGFPSGRFWWIRQEDGSQKGT